MSSSSSPNSGPAFLHSQYIPILLHTSKHFHASTHFSVLFLPSRAAQTLCWYRYRLVVAGGWVWHWTSLRTLVSFTLGSWCQGCTWRASWPGSTGHSLCCWPSWQSLPSLWLIILLLKRRSVWLFIYLFVHVSRQMYLNICLKSDNCRCCRWLTHCAVLLVLCWSCSHVGLHSYFIAALSQHVFLNCWQRYQ